MPRNRKLMGPLQSKRISRATLLSLAAAVLCAHPILNFRFPQSSDAITDAFFIFWTLSAAVACFWRSSRFPRMRRSWRLLSATFLLWSIGSMSSAFSEFVAHASLRSATIDDFFYFFYGVPILLAIAAPDQTESASLFFWLDGLQSAGVGFLAFIALFQAIPFTGERMHPIPVERLVWVFDAENVLLAALATARLAVSTNRSPEKKFLQILSAYLWVYAVCAALNNHVFALYSLATSVDYVIDLPFAVLVFATMRIRLPENEIVHLRERAQVALLLDNARPLLLGLSLVLLAIWVARDAFTIAMVTIAAAFLVYGIRSSYLQTRYQQAQIALEEARDRLEELVLQDGLTRVANRRCFDQRLKQEWNRSRRGERALSLLLIDVDFFKRLNDAHGHLVGDECLVQVAQILRSVLNRSGDLLARYGGEEFVALLPETDSLGARNVASRLQSALRDTPPVPAVERQVTISIGASTWEGRLPGSAQDLVHSADRALYLAKQNGRDRIEFLPFGSE